MRRCVIAGFGVVLLLSCNKSGTLAVKPDKYGVVRDAYSFSNPYEVSVRHATLDLLVSFSKRTLQGNVTLALHRAEGASDRPLVLDSRDLRIGSVTVSSDGVGFRPAKWETGPADDLRGAPITIQLAPNATHVRIEYETSPEASALQWLTPEQTADRRAPFLYTQGQAIHTRSWIPLQDTPGVRMTYSARIRTPNNVMAIMSAGNGRKIVPNGEYNFEMPQPIPPYLIALAVGHLEYKAVDRRTGVYAEPSVIGKAAREFEDLGTIIAAAEPLYGPYRWDQYDVLVLPPSFPYGGMENPRLTFVSPTLIAGDKSLVSVISHELAHSWSGNLVTNATWRDFWLNEGFTTYLERRIQELVYGRERADMEAVIEYEQMLQELETVPDEHEALYASLDGRNPDDIPSAVAYAKGSLFLRTLEQTWGRDRFDAFLRSYFDHFAFKSITTGDFVSYLHANLLSKDAGLAGKVNVDEWLTGSGIPNSVVAPTSERLERAASYARDWVAGKIAADGVPAEKWTVQEWLRFLLALPPVVDPVRLAELDKRFSLTTETNAEVLFQWLITSVRSNYAPAYGAAERFLNNVGRRKFVKPLYEELAKSAEGRKRAQRIYARARSGYHPVTQAAIDSVLR